MNEMGLEVERAFLAPLPWDPPMVLDCEIVKEHGRKLSTLTFFYDFINRCLIID